MRNLRILMVLPLLAIFACSEEPTDSIIDNGSEQANFKDEFTEVAFPEEFGRPADIYYAGRKLPVEQLNGKYIYQGDMFLPEDQVSSSPVNLILEAGETPTERSTGRTKYLWPDNIVYYEIDPSLSNQSRVTDAINHWEANTAVKFVKHTSESNYVYFTPGSGCSSYVGMIGGRQYITLADACSTGNVIHEIGHSVGLWHEQSRADRDNYITVHYDNILSGREYNFYTYVEAGWDGAEYTPGLDFGSIMLYSSYSFSGNGLPTITKTDGSTYSAQRSGLSSGDIEGINVIYPGSTTTTEPTTTGPTTTEPTTTEPTTGTGGSGTGGSTTTETNYINGEYYIIEGVSVLRKDDKWWVQKGRNWKEVELIDGRWRFVK